MKSLLFRIAFFFPFIIFCNHPAKALKSVEKAKTITKQYKVNPDVEINISNRFGKVHINTHDNNEVNLKVVVKVEMKNEDKALDLLDKITIDIDDDAPNELAFRTNIDGKGKGGWNESGTKGMTIDYIVDVPNGAVLDVENSFGDTYLADFAGKVELVSKYGSLKAGSLSGPGSKVKISFGSGSVAHIENGEAIVKFSSFEIYSAGVLELDEQFSNVTLGPVKKLVIDLGHSSLNIQSVYSTEGDASFSPVQIDTLYSDLDFDVKHSDKVMMHFVHNKFKEITVDGSFTTVELHFKNGLNANVDLSSKFGRLRYPAIEGGSYQQEKEMHSESLRAAYGTASSGKANINIDLEYGDVKLVVD